MSTYFTSRPLLSLLVNSCDYNLIAKYLRDGYAIEVSIYYPFHRYPIENICKRMFQLHGLYIDITNNVGRSCVRITIIHTNRQAVRLLIKE